MYHKIVFQQTSAEVALPDHSIPVSQDEAGLSVLSTPWTPSYPSPRFQAQPQQVFQPAQPILSIKPSQNPFIWVIDDSATVRKILETCLGREGFQVKSFSDGVEAMRWLIGPYGRIPDLIWLDIGLPKMDGYEVARRLKTKPQFANTVIIMLSRRDGIIDKLKGRLAGAKDYVTKPFKTEKIIAITQSFVGIATHEQEAPHQTYVSYA